MEKKSFIENTKRLKFIAHRLGYEMTDYPENSLAVLQKIFNDQSMLDACDGFEFDICFTKDNIPVVIHDKYIDDISNYVGSVKSFNLYEIKNIDFNFRKSLRDRNNKNFSFKIVTLEEILEFFMNNYDLLKNKIIKIETKEAIKFSAKNMDVLADIFQKFSQLSKNIVHLSFYPQNLNGLKKIQQKKEYPLLKSDLLCDYSFMIFISYFLKNIDNISCRIKTNDFPKPNKLNTFRVNMKIIINSFFMNFSNSISEKKLEYAIQKYGSIGLYVLNNSDDIEKFCQKISLEFFEKYQENMYFTTDNPLALKRIK